jgi:hypothetical protein
MRASAGQMFSAAQNICLGGENMFIPPWKRSVAAARGFPQGERKSGEPAI